MLVTVIPTLLQISVYFRVVYVRCQLLKKLINFWPELSEIMVLSILTLKSCNRVVRFESVSEYLTRTLQHHFACSDKENILGKLRNFHTAKWTSKQLNRFCITRCILSPALDVCSKNYTNYSPTLLQGQHMECLHYLYARQCSHSASQWS